MRRPSHLSIYVLRFFALRCAWSCASNSCSNRFAFLSSLLGSHVFFQRTLYSLPFPTRLLPTIFLISHSSSANAGVPASPCWGGIGVAVLGGSATGAALLPEACQGESLASETGTCYGRLPWLLPSSSDKLALVGSLRCWRPIDLGILKTGRGRDGGEIGCFAFFDNWPILSVPLSARSELCLLSPPSFRPAASAVRLKESRIPITLVGSPAY